MMNYNREAAEQAVEIARDTTKEFNALLAVVRQGGRNSAVDAAKCANAIEQLRTELNDIEIKFRGFEGTTGDDATIHVG